MTSKILIDTGPSPRGWHRLESALRCEQLYGWGYGHGRAEDRASRFPPTFPLVRGSIGHAGLAHLYGRLGWIQKGGTLESCPLYSPPDAMRLAADSFGDLGDEAHSIASRAVARYAHHYDAERFGIVGVEELAETEFFGYRYTASVDLKFEDSAGMIWFMDHKFVNRIESKVYRRYILSGQFLGLAYLGSRIYGSKFGGVRLNLIGCAVPGFARSTPEPAPYMLERFPYVVKYAEEKIARIEAHLTAGEPCPASPSEHTCWGSYGECPAFEFCRWGGGSIGSLISEGMDAN